MRKITIFGQGGLCNRLCSLLGGLFIAKELSISDINLIWNRDTYCDCNFEKLFYFNFNKLNDLSIDFEKMIFLSHNKWNNKFFKVFKHSINSIKNIKLMDNDIVYNNNRINDYINDNSIIKILNTILINKEILKIVHDYCKINNIDKNVLGIHLRRTDKGNNIDDTQNKINKVKNTPNKKFFVCSDDPHTENLFKEFKNVIIFPKTKYVEKIDKDKDWYVDKPIFYNCPYNIFRSEESVIQGFIDLLILSRTNLDFMASFSSSKKYAGTFLYIAFLYNNIDIFNQL